MGEHAVGQSSRSTEDTAFAQDSARGCRIPEQPLISLMSFDKTVAHPIAGSPGIAQTTAFEEIIQIYLRDVDRTLIRGNLALTPAQRLQKLEEFVEFLRSAKIADRRAS
jgi:hypothetical protein